MMELQARIAAISANCGSMPIVVSSLADRKQPNQMCRWLIAARDRAMTDKRR